MCWFFLCTAKTNDREKENSLQVFLRMNTGASVSICSEVMNSPGIIVAWNSVKILPLSVSRKLGNTLLLCGHSCCFDSAFISVSVFVPQTNLFLFCTCRVDRVNKTSQCQLSRPRWVSTNASHFSAKHSWSLHIQRQMKV